MTSQQLMLGTNRAEIIKKQQGAFTSTSDQLAIEESLQILWKLEFQKEFQPLSMTMRTPGNDIDLAVGYLLSEGIISSTSDLVEADQICSNKVSITLKKHIDLEQIRNKNFITSSSCGVCGKTSSEDIFLKHDLDIINDRFTINQSYLNGLLNQLEQTQSLFSLTGGIHAAALFNNSGDLISIREDVGRHNALDKLIGNQALTESSNLQGHTLLLSGRASFELIQKASIANIPIVIAVGAPSSAAVALANENGQTLIGFFKGERFNIYSHGSRIED